MKPYLAVAAAGTTPVPDLKEMKAARLVGDGVDIFESIEGRIKEGKYPFPPSQWFSATH
jgi:hypothetical protein